MARAAAIVGLLPAFPCTPAPICARYFRARSSIAISPEVAENCGLAVRGFFTFARSQSVNQAGASATSQSSVQEYEPFALTLGGATA